MASLQMLLFPARPLTVVESDSGIIVLNWCEQWWAFVARRTSAGPAASENVNWSLFRVYERPPIRDPVPVHLILPTNNRANIPRSFDESVFFCGPAVQLGRSAADKEKHPKIQRRRLQSIIILSRVYVNLLAANSASKQEALKQYREHVTPQSCCRQISGVICALTRGSAAADALISNGEKRSAAYLVRPRRARRKAHAERARPRDTATATATATHPPAQRIRPWPRRGTIYLNSFVIFKGNAFAFFRISFLFNLVHIIVYRIKIFFFRIQRDQNTLVFITN